MGKWGEKEGYTKRPRLPISEEKANCGDDDIYYKQTAAARVPILFFSIFNIIILFTIHFFIRFILEKFTKTEYVIY